MGYFRILLIPVFTWIYVQADSVSDYYTAAVLVGISGLTDMFDGKVARKFNMITELGKFIDPLADKLTQGALVICFAIRYPLMRAVLVLFIVKEGFMGIMGLLLLHRGGRRGRGEMVRKVCDGCPVCPAVCPSSVSGNRRRSGQRPHPHLRRIHALQPDHVYSRVP